MMATKIIITCSLMGYDNMPSMITGELVMKTKKFYVVRIENKEKTDFLEVTVKKKRCRE